MRWIKHGKIFDLSEPIPPLDRGSYAQSPQALVFDGFVRIYFSTRERDSFGKYLSQVAFADFDFASKKIINLSTQQVIRLGKLGCFDEHGIFPFSPLKVNNEVWAYTCGWSRRQSVPVETSTGLSISTDNGVTYHNIGPGPILSSSLEEPMLVGDSFVRRFEDKFHMWYIFGEKWIPATKAEPPARVYKITHAVSFDGIEWHKPTKKQLITDTLGADECQALPSVIKLNDVYHMVFCYRRATDFRNNRNNAYRLGYARSHDLLSWTRNDDELCLERSDSGWDSQMMCYPHLFEVNGKVFLLYNGNDFGRYGFGLAELSSI